MIKVTITEPSGEERTISVRGGFSLMEAAVANGIEGIEADCGGACSCATCHVLVDADWLGRLPEPKDYEDDLLEALDNRAANSRLSCQIPLDDHLDGLRVSVPAED